MTDLQTLLGYLTPISLTIGVIYHIMTLNNTRKNQQLQLETRQLNTYMEFKRNLLDTVSSWNEVIFQHEWKDYDDWVEKYGPLTNPDAFGDTLLVFEFINGLGLLVRKGILDIDIVCE